MLCSLFITVVSKITYSLWLQHCLLKEITSVFFYSTVLFTEQRKAEASKIREKYPERIPVSCISCYSPKLCLISVSFVNITVPHDSHCDGHVIGCGKCSSSFSSWYWTVVTIFRTKSGFFYHRVFRQETELNFEALYSSK